MSRLVMGQFSLLSLKIWVWDMCLPSLYQNCFQVTKMTPEFHLLKISLIVSRMMKIFWNNYNGYWIVGLWLWPPKQRLGLCRGRPPTSPRPKKSQMSWSSVKILLTIFFDHKAIVYHGQTINNEYYHNSYAGCYLSEKATIACNQWLVIVSWQITWPLSSTFGLGTAFPRSDKHCILQILLLATFTFFQKSKGRFQDVKEIKVNTMSQLLIILENAFQECFHRWKQWYWIKCVVSEKDYFERD